ncbi:MAG: hypothetical protein ACFFD2_15480 [Promethearchaeota archaeon]
MTNKKCDPRIIIAFDFGIESARAAYGSLNAEKLKLLKNIDS